jgi:hypothetical protein
VVRFNRTGVGAGTEAADFFGAGRPLWRAAAVEVKAKRMSAAVVVVRRRRRRGAEGSEVWVKWRLSSES